MAARYQLQDHADFSDLLTREDLYVLNQRGSVGRGEMCLDYLTGRMHTVGEIISSVRRARVADGEARVERPAYVEVIPEGLDLGGDEEEDEDWEDEEEEDDGLPHLGFTSTGERIFYHAHPSWLRYGRAWLLCALLTVGAALGSIQGVIFLAAGAAAAFGVLLVVAVARFSRDYYITEERVECLWGVIGRSSKEVRIRDIRSIDVRESWVTGMLGLGCVDFSSAANAGIEVSFEMIRSSHRVKELVRLLQRLQDEVNGGRD
ncbi:MAG: PH domain-containing protein [Verrucomicrobiales bacterium]|nr:PH domain-containing protein [Verrucomicrobiales bacterium]